MISSVLRSRRAIDVNIAIMHTFVIMKGMLASNAELTRILDAPERKYDARFMVVFEAIREIFKPPDKPQRPKGFQIRETNISRSVRRRNKK
jgi:hypothetical protein